MKPKSIREKWLTALLPGVLLFFLGWSFYLRPAESQIALLRQRVKTQGSVETRLAAVARAQSEGTTLSRTLAAHRAKPTPEDITFDRNAAMQEVSALCASCQLSLNKSDASPAARLPKNLQDAVPAMGEGSTKPQLWQIELTGSYSGIIALLEGLEKAHALVVPLNITMTPGKTERQPANWIVTLWL